MKVLLISVNDLIIPHAVYPLGMSVVAKTLSNAGIVVKQFDYLTESKSYFNLNRALDEFCPQIVGISIRNFRAETLSIIKDILKIIKNKQNIKIFAGGSGFSSFYNEIMNIIDDIDYGFIGNAEEDIVKFVYDIYENKQKEKLFFVKQINSINGALYDPKIVDFYKNFDYAVNVNTRKGCKYRCLYCEYNEIDGHVIRYRDIDSIVDDLKLLKKLGVTTFSFADNIFNSNKEFCIKLLEKIINNNINMKWFAYFRPDLIEEDMLKIMVKAGLSYCHVGVDATTDETLISMRKDFNWESVKKASSLLNKYDNINSLYTFIFGAPNETAITLEKGISNIKNLNIKNFHITIFFGREKYDMQISDEYIEKVLIKNFGENNYYLHTKKY